MIHRKLVLKQSNAKRRFVVPTITEEASLTDVTLTSGGHGGRRGEGRHGGGRHGGGRHGGGGRGH